MEPALTGAILVADTALIDPAEVARRADAQIYGPSWEMVDEEQVRAAHAAGIRVLPWTANGPEQWQGLLACQVDGITTDYPDRLAAYVRSAGTVF
jgi:glycerophosphoryl diester phosphodiesterase